MKQGKQEMGITERKSPKNPEQLKIGDNVLIRDHTSKAFQPKYKDFLGKNQVEIKDNHGHTTKVHRRDVKKIPMTEKLCQLYKEEQVGKVRSEKTAIPDSKMPVTPMDTCVPLFLETVIAIVILLVTFITNIKWSIQEITPEIKQTATDTTRKISCNKFFKRTTETYRKTIQVVSDATRLTTHNSCPGIHRKSNSSTQNRTSVQKPYDQHDGSYALYSNYNYSNNSNQ